MAEIGQLFLFLCTVFQLCSGLTLPYMVTTKPRHTKYSSSIATPVANGSVAVPSNATIIEGKGEALYRVNDNKGSTCILLKTDALIELSYKSNIGEETEDIYIPENALVEGNCKYEDESSMRLSWKGYTLILSFSKTPGGERWYITNVELRVNTNVQKHHKIANGRTLALYHEKMVMPTPVGKSYSCDETVITLLPKEDITTLEDLKGTLYLRSLRIQPFMYKGPNFEVAFKCNAAKSFHDETAPIAVGSTLAVAALLTITGYAVFRYFKIKKVQYNTME
ncbi:PREDICTED: uncharacterized protein LOC108563737 [Nicrophorus vespilloides]|uniref:Uncharacterized protein LOC108563737 n=1 Tax=Nicrophorus vespilloides TaxID=110193 RepID=A0ABM1MTT1_NICVS|nr:PREDICTED: uncharacterized protein LOC108563737 [Nicrophorus vespilloides]